MKKKTVVFGSLMAVFLMIMIPTASAVEYQSIVKTHETYLLNELNSKQFEALSLRNKIKNENSKTLCEELHNVEIGTLKEMVLQELGNSDINEEQKTSISQLLDSDLLFTVLLKGILIPVIIFTISAKFDVYPFWAGFFVPPLLIIPVAKMVEKETGISESSITGLLTIVDILIANILLALLRGSKNNLG